MYVSRDYRINAPSICYGHNLAKDSFALWLIWYLRRPPVCNYVFINWYCVYWYSLLVLLFDTLIPKFFIMINDYLLCLSVKYYRPIFIAVKCFVHMSTFGNTKYILKSILTSLLLIPHSYRLRIYYPLTSVPWASGGLLLRSWNEGPLGE